MIADDPQIGIVAGYFKPDAAQWMTSASRATSSVPSARMSRPRSTSRTCPRRTTCSMLRNNSSSQDASVGVFAIVGITVWSIRSMMPASSRRRNRSCSVLDSAAASMVLATMPKNTGGSGWTTARLSIHGSRGLTQQIASAPTPWVRSHTHASVAVLPDPTTTY